MKKIFSKKLMFVIAILSVLAMMIPMSIPVSAAGVSLATLDAVGGTNWVADSGYNVIGTVVRVTGGGVPVIVNGTLAQLVTGSDYVNYTVSENDFVNGPDSANKKWGTIDHTTFGGANGGSSYVTWNEGTKSWSSPVISITDTVTGMFHSGVNSAVVYHSAQGAILNWYLVDGSETVPMAAGEADALKVDMDKLKDATFTTFTTGGKYVQTVTDSDGESTVSFSSVGEESIKIVVVPEYPGSAQDWTTPEVTTYNFMTREMEVVPQVRWAGEKIVLEANFNLPSDVRGGKTVKFSLSNDSPGLLSALDGQTTNNRNTTMTVWTTVDQTTGLASVVLECANQGQVDVNATLYDNDTDMLNQQDFTVYYLKLESLVISEVVGKRALYEEGILISHKDGQWVPANPWDVSLDIEDEELNVSTDALIRARVKGWFTNANPTTRVAGEIDITPGDGLNLALPAGRYVLPDDWALLAGPMIGTRIHWDIMDAPNDTVKGKTTKGAFGDYAAPVIGPFSPGIEVMTDTGWAKGIVSNDTERQIKTVVPNGDTNWWDAPMPPAKIVFQINAGVGFFKDAYKSTIYYTGNAADPTSWLYTAPFYFVNIPAHQAIPPVTANGGYDWDSFDFNNQGDNYGPYEFWKIINEPAGPVTPENAALPTKVEVYSDNHGEAMVYLNGDANLGLTLQNGLFGVDYMDVMGTSTVQAWADYPYFRKHQAIYSNDMVKTWTWGGQLLGPSNGDGAPMILVAGTDGPGGEITLDPGFVVTDADAQGKSAKHVVWIWVSDRDGMQAGMLDARVDWAIDGANTYIWDGAFTGINNNNNITKNLKFDANGFLENIAHPSVRAAGLQVTSGSSWLRKPTTGEKELFAKFWPTLDANNFAVSAIDVISQASGEVHITQYITPTDFGKYYRYTDFNTTVSYPLDDAIVLGDANLDGSVNMMDITAVERIILGMQQSRTVQSDANYNGVIDMGDVIRIEKTYLGLN